MSKSSQDGQTFSNQNALLRVAMGANIVAWIIVALTLVDFISIVKQIYQNWPLNLPTNLFDQLAFWVTNVISRYGVDVFYIFVLFGIAQLIYLGLDIYYAQSEDTELVAEQL
jgi:hypothetical protein